MAEHPPTRIHTDPLHDFTHCYPTSRRKRKAHRRSFTCRFPSVRRQWGQILLDMGPNRQRQAKEWQGTWVDTVRKSEPMQKMHQRRALSRCGQVNKKPTAPARHSPGGRRRADMPRVVCHSRTNTRGVRACPGCDITIKSPEKGECQSRVHKTCIFTFPVARRPTHQVEEKRSPFPF